jgi:hypothetical protein
MGPLKKYSFFYAFLEIRLTITMQKYEKKFIHLHQRLQTGIDR